MSTSSGFCNSCPEVPSAITINQTTITVDGSTSFFSDERFTIGLGNITTDSDGAYTRMALDYVPISVMAVTLFRNGVAQRRGVDYGLVGSTVVLYDAAVADDTFLVHYFTAENTVADSPIGTGTRVGFDWGADTSVVPSGWVACDGATSYSKATYPALWVYCRDNSLVASSTTTTFVITELKTELYTGSTTVYEPTIIKT